MGEKLKTLLVKFDIRRFLKFGLVGILNTLVDFGVFFVLDTWVIREGPTVVLLGLSMAAGPYISNTVSYIAGNINSFVWNRFWTFQKRERVTAGEVGRFLVTAAGYLVLSNLCLAFFMWVLEAWALPFIPAGAIPTAAKVPTTCVAIFYNYLMNKFWVFK